MDDYREPLFFSDPPKSQGQEIDVQEEKERIPENREENEEIEEKKTNILDVQNALSLAGNYLKRLKLHTSANSVNLREQGTSEVPIMLDMRRVPPPNFEFNHNGNIVAKTPTFLINQLLRRVMAKEDPYINWARLEYIDSVSNMVVIVLADVNGVELFDLIKDNKLSSLKNINNKEHSVVFDLPKQNDKTKFWSKIFECPKLEESEVTPPNSFKGNNYLLCPEDLKLLDYPSELNKQCTFFTQTDLWPPVPKTEFNRILSLDCEMVLTNSGQQVVKISMVDEAFQVVYDTLIQPIDTITDYLTQ